MVCLVFLYCSRIVSDGISWADDTIYDHKFAPEDVLGLDHVDKSGKTRTGSGEKAIVIRGWTLSAPADSATTAPLYIMILFWVFIR